MSNTTGFEMSPPSLGCFGGQRNPGCCRASPGLDSWSYKCPFAPSLCSAIHCLLLCVAALRLPGNSLNSSWRLKELHVGADLGARRYLETDAKNSLEEKWALKSHHLATQSRGDFLVGVSRFLPSETLLDRASWCRIKAERWDKLVFQECPLVSGVFKLVHPTMWLSSEERDDAKPSENL